MGGDPPAPRQGRGRRWPRGARGHRPPAECPGALVLHCGRAATSVGPCPASSPSCRNGTKARALGRIVSTSRHGRSWGNRARVRRSTALGAGPRRIPPGVCTGVGLERAVLASPAFEALAVHGRRRRAQPAAGRRAAGVAVHVRCHPCVAARGGALRPRSPSPWSCAPCRPGAPAARTWCTASADGTGSRAGCGAASLGGPLRPTRPLGRIPGPRAGPGRCRPPHGCRGGCSGAP